MQMYQSSPEMSIDTPALKLSKGMLVARSVLSVQHCSHEAIM